MENYKDPVYGTPTPEAKKMLIKAIDKMCYQLGVKKPPKPQFGGCYYDRDFNQIYIKEVIYNNPAVIVYWSDGTKTTSKCHPEDIFDTEKGLLLCVVKKLVDSDFAVKTLEDWSEPELGKNRKTLADVRKAHKSVGSK